VLTAETLTEAWSRVLGLVGVLLAADLSKANLPAIFGPNTLVIRFPEAYTKSRDSCQTPGNVARVEEALKKVTGRVWTLRIETTPTTAAVGDASGVAAPEAPLSVRPPRRNYREEAEKEPLVKRALDVMGAQVLRVDEGFGTKPPEVPAPAGAGSDEEEA
jgi:hypothetical protein